MNQQCKVCGEPAAGFHFGAFTCEGCKSFFGRSYNNLNSITECKNNGECIINKKNRTACKSCRLRKCLLVGMSKSGSRYGRRSNWFKIHCLLQEQQQAAVAHINGKPPPNPLDSPLPLLSPLPFPPHPNLPPFLRPNAASSPSVSSPDSDSSDPALYPPRPNNHNPFAPKDLYLPVPFHPLFMQPPALSAPFLLPPSLLPFPLPPARAPPDAPPPRLPSPSPSPPPSPSSPPSPPSPTTPCAPHHHEHDTSHTIKCNNNCSNTDIVNNNNNDSVSNNNNNDSEEDRVRVRSKRFYLDAILGLKSAGKCGSGGEGGGVFGEEQDNPIDLSLKRSSLREVSSQESGCQTDDPGEEDLRAEVFAPREDVKPIPLDLSV